jgi:hypothetical protein
MTQGYWNSWTLLSGRPALSRSVGGEGMEGGGEGGGGGRERERLSQVSNLVNFV